MVTYLLRNRVLNPTMNRDNMLICLDLFADCWVQVAEVSCAQSVQTQVLAINLPSASLQEFFSY